MVPIGVSYNLELPGFIRMPSLLNISKMNRIIVASVVEDMRYTCMHQERCFQKNQSQKESINLPLVNIH